MKKSTQNLSADLQNYLNKHRNDPNFWNRDPIGTIIQKFCKARGNFKKAPSGNPAKGFKKMMEARFPSEENFPE